MTFVTVIEYTLFYYIRLPASTRDRIQLRCLSLRLECEMWPSFILALLKQYVILVTRESHHSSTGATRIHQVSTRIFFSNKNKQNFYSEIQTRCTKMLMKRTRSFYFIFTAFINLLTGNGQVFCGHISIPSSIHNFVTVLVFFRSTLFNNNNILWFFN